MSDSYNANIYLKPSDLNNIEDRIEELTEECQERIFGKDDTTYSGTDFQIDTHDVIQGYLTQIDGQTTQEGTPTPDSPVPINVVSGRQVVRVCGKNILNLNSFSGATVSGITLTPNFVDNKLISITTSGTYSSSTYITLTNTQKVQPNTNYVLSGGYSPSARLRLREYDSNNTQLSEYFDSGNGISFTSKSNVEHINIQVVFYASNPNAIFYPQLELGETPTTYEEYKGIDYEINLGKNLFYINDCTITQNGGTVSVSNGNTITITGTFSAGTNFSFDSYVNFTNANTQLGNAITLSVQNIVNQGTTSITPNRFFLGSINTLLYMQPNQTTGIITKTLEETLTRCRLYVPEGTYNTTFNIQLEKGNQSSGFSPYKTPIYLGKIGTYQDYIFKNTTENPLYDSTLEEGQWYIHKEIGRVVLNGSENWGYSGGNSVFYTTSITDYALSNNIPYSNYYNGITNVNGAGGMVAPPNNTIAFINISGQTTPRFYIKDTRYTTNTNDLKTWLSTHPLEVYYVLNTPTNTLIEDEELINQLESIQLISGLNNIIVSSSNLSGIITIQSYLASFYRNIEVGDDLGGKTLYLSLPRTIHESIPDTDTSSHPFISMNVDAYIVYRYVGGYKYIGIRLPDPDNPNNHSIYYFYGYSTANQKGNPYLNHVRYTLPKNFGKVVSINKNNDIFKYIKIYDEKLIPNYEKHIWVDNEQVTMQKIDHIEKGVSNIGLYYEKPNGWVNEKEWLPTANKKYHSNYGVGIKTISYQDLNRWYNNLDLIDFSDLNEITIWNAVDDISQIEWNGESDEEWVDNFNLVLYDFTTEDNNTLITENGDTMLILVNERV